MGKKALLMGLIAFLAGCATTEPPPGAFKADVGFPSPGTKWVSRTVDHTGAATTKTLTVLEEGAYEGKPAYRVSDGVNVVILDKATRNWIATLRGEKVRFANSPHDGTFSPPLWVGKSWLASYQYYDYDLGRSFTNVYYRWRVEAYEDITVPAGTFKAFRLEGNTPYSSTTLWYAPGVKLIVKRVYERGIGHYLGSGKFVTELIEYPAK